MPLTDTAIRNAKAQDKQYKISDERGLYLLVKNSGKYFRFDYRYQGKRKTLALGVYPEVRLKEAREKRDENRKLLQNDIDPATGITAPDLLTVFRRVEERGANDTAHRIKQICGQILRYAVATGRAERDSSLDLKGALSPVKHTHMATITDPKKIGELMRAIDGYEGHLVTRCALRLAPLVFVRPGELRYAEWSEIDQDKAKWKIPAEKMKIRSTHIVPLSLDKL